MLIHMKEVLNEAGGNGMAKAKITARWGSLTIDWHRLRCPCFKWPFCSLEVNDTSDLECQVLVLTHVKELPHDVKLGGRCLHAKNSIFQPWNNQGLIRQHVGEASLIDK